MYVDDFMDYFIPAAILLVVVLLGWLFVSDPLYCADRWSKSGMRAEYTFGPGCMVQRGDGTWVPERSIKALTAPKG